MAGPRVSNELPGNLDRGTNTLHRWPRAHLVRAGSLARVWTQFTASPLRGLPPALRQARTASSHPLQARWSDGSSTPCSQRPNVEPRCALRSILLHFACLLARTRTPTGGRATPPARPQAAPSVARLAKQSWRELRWRELRWREPHRALARAGRRAVAARPSPEPRRVARRAAPQRALATQGCLRALARAEAQVCREA